MNAEQGIFEVFPSQSFHEYFPMYIVESDVDTHTQGARKFSCPAVEDEVVDYKCKWARKVDSIKQPGFNCSDQTSHVLLSCNDV